MEYPSWRFHRTEEARIIPSAEHEEEGWEGSPLAFGIETAPGVELDPEVASRAKAPAATPTPVARKGARR